MKKIVNVLIVLILIAVLFCAVACEQTPVEPDPTPSTPILPEPITPDYTLTRVSDRVELRERDILSYDFTTLFKITTTNGLVKPVLPSYLDLSKLPISVGEGLVTCNYEDQSVSVKVVVLKPVYELSLSVESVTLFDNEVMDYDFNSLFTLTRDGEKTAITDDMIQTNISTVKGDYYYRVTMDNATKTLRVTVKRSSTAVIYRAYSSLSIVEQGIDSYDYDSLFVLYVDGIRIPNSEGVLDISAKDGKTVGDSFDISFKYDLDGDIFISTVTVNVVSEPDYSVNSKSVVVYPNEGFLDLTTLFEITKGDDIIPVTLDMLSGDIDYQNIGNYTVTLTFNGIEYTANVEVRRGVKIETPKSVVTVRKGISKSTYAFEDDFIVMVNGIRFESIDSFIDIESVDFDTVGEYTATITIKYNDNTFSLTKPVNFTEYSASVTYVVVENEYTASVKETSIILPEGTTDYYLYGNLDVTVNGKKQAFVLDPTKVDAISCYVELLSAPIDFDSPREQDVKIAVYVNGVNSAPVILSYSLRIVSSIVIEANDVIAFTGDNVYPYDIFKVYKNGIAVDYDKSLVSGVYSLDKAGVYTLKIEYERITEMATLTVLDKNILGVYETELRSLAVEEEIDEEGNVMVDAVTSKKIGDMEFLSFDSLSINGHAVTEIQKLDESKLFIKLSNWEYEASFVDGIAFINPINKNNFNFSDSYRPLLYVNTAIWKIEQRLQINEKQKYVLEYGYAPAYSIDAVKLSRIDGSETKWFAMKTDFLSHINNDYFYKAIVGDCYIPDDQSFATGSKGFIEFDGKSYSFELTRRTEGRIIDNEVGVDSKYLGRSFSGLVDGKTATLSVNNKGNVSLLINSKPQFTDKNTLMLANGGFNALDDTLHVYDYNGGVNGIYSYKFALDLNDSTFTLIEKDGVFGKFYSDNAYYYFDGYGTGLASLDLSSYKTFTFSYSYMYGQIDIEFKDTVSSEPKTAIKAFFLDDFGNVLTEKTDDSYSGVKLENAYITTGALIKISDNTVGSGNSTVAKAELLDSITIITADGELTVDQKKNIVKTTTVKFSEAGFYQYSITLPVGSKEVTSYYAVRIIPKVSGLDDLIGFYSSTQTARSSITIDEYGRVKLVADTRTYIGFVNRTDDGFISVASADGKKAVINATVIENGLLRVNVQGDSRITDFYTTGSVRSIGCDKLLLREYTLNDGIKKYAVFNMGNFGELCTVTLLNGKDITVSGAIVELKLSSVSVIVKVSSWGDIGDGLVVQDGFRSEYQDGDSTLFLDGFGLATLDGNNYTYTIIRGRIVLIEGNTSFVVELGTNDYKKMNIALDNTLIQGKSFSAEYIFGDNDNTAKTTFSFRANGVVAVVSESADMGDSYSPDFITADSTLGTYTVSANKVTVKVGTAVIVFTINDVTVVDTMYCSSTTVTYGTDGYFRVGTTFERA